MANPLGLKGPSPKPFRDALRAEIVAGGDDHKTLRRVARALIAKAESGDVSAISALIDRLDGKVPQPTGGSDELGPHRLHISWKANDGSDLQPLTPEPALVEQAAFHVVDGKQSEKSPANIEQVDE